MHSQKHNLFESDLDFELWLREETRKRRVLVIDDDYFMHFAVGRALEGTNGQLFSAYSGTQGINLFSEINPDVVWLDCKIGETDGTEVFRKIRELEKQSVDPNASLTPVIFVSRYLDTKIIEDIYRIDLALLLRKPDDLNVRTLHKVFRYFSIKRTARISCST